MDALFLGDHPATDYLNTVASPAGEAVEFIGDGNAFVQWLVQADLLASDQAASLRRRFTGVELDAVAGRARQERESFREWIAQWVEHPRRNYAQEITHLNGLLALGPCTRHLSRGAAGSPAAASERWQLQLARPQALLALTAGAVSSLIAHEDPALVRHCAGRNCTLWFVDRTKAHRRIYCTAAVCGNRAKVAAFRERQRAR